MTCITPPAPTCAGSPPAQAKHERRIVRLWFEDVRTEQMNRFCGLHEIQSASEVTIQAALTAWQDAKSVQDALPSGKRVDLPAPQMFAKVLGFLRSGATLKTPMLRIELSIKEIAQRLRIGVSTVKQVIRWLGCGPIRCKGEVVAYGLRLLHRARRVARGALFGKEQWLYRTSEMVLTIAGRLLLDLKPLGGDPLGVHSDDGDEAQDWQALKRQRTRERRRRHAMRKAQQRAADEAQKRAGRDAMRRMAAEVASEERPHPLERVKTAEWRAKEKQKAKEAAERAAVARVLAAQEAANDEAMREAMDSFWALHGDTRDKRTRRQV